MTDGQVAARELVGLLRRAREASAEARWGEAAGLWGEVVARSPADGGRWASLGMALAGEARWGEAAAALERALELGAAFPPPEEDYELCFPWRVAYEVARCRARAGETGAALAWLERSLALGLRDRGQIATDEALASLPRSRLRALAALPEGPEEDEGAAWARDVAWLAGEIRRVHYAPFRHVGEGAFEAAARQLEASVAEMTPSQRHVGVMRLMRLLGDGHSRVAFWQEREEQRAAPVTCYWFEEGLFVTAAAPQHAWLVGRRVTRVGGLPAEEALRALDAVVSQDNPQWLRLMAPFLVTQPAILCGLGLAPDPRVLPLTVAGDGGEELAAELAAEGPPVLTTRAFGPPEDWARVLPREQAALPRYLRDAGNYWFEEIPEHGAVYVQYRRVVEEPGDPFEAFCERLFEAVDAGGARRLVVDLRRNSGGNTFMHRPLLAGIMARPQLTAPGGLVAIVGRNTFSAAMNGAVMLERHAGAVFAGEPTGASPNFVGETVVLTMPRTGLQVSLSDLYWQTSWPVDSRRWIAPLLHAPPTFADYAALRDPALDMALAYEP